MEDLISRLVMAGLQAALRYDPGREHAGYGSNGGDPFSSYLADIFQHRAVDYWRSKGEGFGDRRYGFDNRVDVTDPDDLEPADHDTDFDALVDDRRRSRWQQAAEAAGLSLSEWVAVALDRVALNQMREAA